MISGQSPERSDTVSRATSKLPPTVLTKDGQIIDLTGDAWLMKRKAGLSASLNVRWTTLRLVKVKDTQRLVLTEPAIHLFKTYLGHRMSTLFPISIYEIFLAALSFAKWLAKNAQWFPQDRSFDWSDLTVDLFTEWVKAEQPKTKISDFARSIRNFYQWGVDSEDQPLGFSEEVAKGLTLISLESRSVGEAVASRDKRRGPFSRKELEIILDACEAGKGDDRDRAITWTLLCTALRPHQLALLTRRDLQIFGSDDQNGAGESSDKRPAIHQSTTTARGGGLNFVAP